MENRIKAEVLYEFTYSFIFIGKIKLSMCWCPFSAIGYGILLMFLSFIVFYFSAESTVGLVIGIILIDIGLQAIHISNQTRVYSILPEARNRMNTVFMSFSFFGTALGSAFGLFLWKVGAWEAVSLGGMALVVVAFGVYAFTYKSKRKRVNELQNSEINL